MTNWPGTVIKQLKHIETYIQGIRGTSGLDEACTKVDNPPLAIHKALVVVPGAPASEVTSNERPI
eukprot:10342102-Heterocapsa_arctica.AAC.1